MTTKEKRLTLGFWSTKLFYFQKKLVVENPAQLILDFPLEPRSKGELVLRSSRYFLEKYSPEKLLEVLHKQGIMVDRNFFL